MLKFDSKLQSVIAKNATQIVGSGIDVLNRPLSNTAIARVGQACDIYSWNTIVNRVDATRQILDSQLLNRIPARIDWKHVVNGAVVAEFEFIDVPRRQRKSALHRNVLPSLWIVGVCKGSRCEATSLVPNVALEKRMTR